MINGISATYGHHANCEVCDCVIPEHYYLREKDLGYHVCSAFDCKKVMQKKTTMTPVMFKLHLAFNKKIIHIRREKVIARNNYIKNITEKERNENNDILQLVLRENSMLTEATTHLMVIPSGDSKSVPLRAERLKKYILHLNYIVNEAASYANASQLSPDEHSEAYGKRLLSDQRFSENPELHNISDELCKMCKGGCCASGKEHAYLSVFSMRRFMDENTSLSSADILDIYFSAINNETIENSCINQTKTGCSLPRELRSDICNEYHCESLRSYQKKMQTTENPEMVLAVKRSSTYWNRFEPGVCNEIVDVSLLGMKQHTKIKWQ